ncbi:MAG: ATP-binding protein [Armatimonadota bacterium]
MRELSMHILDLAQNSLVAGADMIEIEVIADTTKDSLKLFIKDNGKGMDEEFLAKVIDPFTTTRRTRRVGLGIPMLLQAAQSCDGSFHIDSKPGEGTQLCAEFVLSHIDRAPLGDISATIITLIAPNPDVNFRYVQKKDDKEFVLDTAYIKKELGDVPINEPSILSWISDYVKEGTSGDLAIN